MSSAEESYSLKTFRLGYCGLQHILVYVLNNVGDDLPY